MADQMTDDRARRGVKPDLIGWEAIAAELGITRKQAMAWERKGMPVVSWGPTQVAAYSDRVRAWATTKRAA